MPSPSDRSPRLVAIAIAVAILPVLGACTNATPEDVATDDGPTVQSDTAVTLRVDVASDDDAVIDGSVAVIRRRIAALGHETVDVARDGSTLEITVPGGDEELLRATMEQSGALEFRPVLATLGAALSGAEAEAARARVTELRASLALPDDVTAAQVVRNEQELETDPAAEPTTASGAFNRWGVDVYATGFSELFQLEGVTSAEPTPLAELDADAEATLVGVDGTLFLLGPVAVDSTSVTSATAAEHSGDWAVSPVLSSGDDAIGAFNAVAAQCYDGDRSCPRTVGEHGQLAIVADGVVLSAPSINQPSFEADSISISGGFDETSAMALAAALDAGTAPATWTVRD